MAQVNIVFDGSAAFGITNQLSETRYRDAKC